MKFEISNFHFTMKRSDEKGVALIITLLVVTLLTALIVEFAYSARVNLSAAGNFRDKQKAYYLAKSGVNFIGGMLKDNASKSKADDIDQMLPPVTVGDGIVSLKAFDESAKINIKDVKPTNKTARARLDRLFEIKGIGAYLLDGIFERESYSLVSELRLARGMTDEVYDKIENHLTVYGDGTGKININTADKIVLQSLNISEYTIQKIIEYRQKNRFKDAADLKNNVVDISDAVIQSDIKFESNHYSVISTGTVNEVDSTIETVLWRKSGAEITRLYWRSQ
ncbi:MAG: general secretion pathway protein GspK [Nitrospirae bacterium]|nr:general secretion pathway protein GspK [Nitrospirota bacterium]